MKRALITGITGQDGPYLAEYLLGQGYQVFGLIRGQNNPKRSLVEELLPQVKLIEGDLLDQASLIGSVEAVAPDEVYNLASISFVPLSFKQPELTAEVTGLGVTRLLEAIRLVNKRIKFYQASSSEMFGKVLHSPQNEDTPFHPRSPYGVAKVYAHYITLNYRESYGIFACSGIAFNHESPRRGLEFVTRKITYAAARVKMGLQHELVLGNLEARRDWGYTGDYVKAMHLMLQHDQPDDYVIATGESHTVAEFAELAFSRLGLDWKRFVRTDPSLLRPAEVEHLVGDAAKARRLLGWQPQVTFRQLVEMMVDSDLKLNQG